MLLFYEHRMSCYCFTLKPEPDQLDFSARADVDGAQLWHHISYYYIQI